MTAGETDLRALGFWRIVGEVKRDPALVARHADRIGRIDTAAFRSRVRLRVPVWAGNALLGLALLAGVAAIVVAGTTTGTVAGAAFLFAVGAWSLGVHSPTHWVVGRFMGIRFTDYFLGGPPPPRPGLKTDYATYLRAEPGRRAWFHASGAIATKLAPFAALALVARDERPRMGPGGRRPATGGSRSPPTRFQRQDERLEEVVAGAGVREGHPAGMIPSAPGPVP